MQNPRDNACFEIDYLICVGTYQHYLDAFLKGLLLDGSDEHGKMTEFTQTLYEQVLQARKLLETRTRDCDQEILKYELEQRLVNTKEEEQQLRNEFNEKRA